MSINLSVDDGKTTVLPGTIDTYTIVVSNTGPNAVTGASVFDALPAGATGATWLASTGSANVTGPTSGSGALATTVNLPVNASVTFTFATTINPSVTGSFVNAAVVTPPGGTPFTAADTDTLTPTADLSVIITDGRTTVVPGASDIYTIVVSNAGPSTAVAATVTDLFPAAFTSVSWTAVASSGSSVAAASGVGNINTLVTLLPFGTATYTVVALVSPSAAGSLANTVSVASSAGTTDPNLANNTATDLDAPSAVNLSPPVGTTADMILRASNTSPIAGQYEIYDIGNNAILAAGALGQVATDFQFAGLGRFFGSDTTDMLLRSASTGAFEVYDISNNNITNTAFLGNVGLDWRVVGFGNFSSMPGETDMILRNSNTAGVEVYDISNNQITGAAFMGAVGLDWQFSGVGNFSGLGESDMLLRNSNTGGLEVYDISNNQISGAAFIGTVGVDWKFSGVGNFSGVAGETDLLLRNVNTGGLEVYDINNNQLTNAAFIGTVGLEWQFAGIAPIHAAGASDLVLRNVNTGAFEVYDIANNQLAGAASLGAVGLDWQVGGFAADPPTGSIGSSGSVSQLVQAMAGFGGGSGTADTSNTVPLGVETSQQPLLTTPQHA
jgi:uncharacterized repeat protein (TIGR01451 family)